METKHNLQQMYGSRFSYFRVAVIPTRIRSNFISGYSGANLHIQVDGGKFYCGTLPKNIQHSSYRNVSDRNKCTMQPLW